MPSRRLLSRRSVLRSLLASGFTTVSGCSRGSQDTLTERSRASKPTKTAHSETTDHRTPRDASTSSRTRSQATVSGLVFGEWYSSPELPGWRITAAGLTLTPTFELDEGGRYEMPKDEQLAVVRARVENTEASRDGWGMPLDFLLDAGTVVWPVGWDFDHPAFSKEVKIDRLTRVDHAKQYENPEGLVVPGGETRRFWEVGILPRSVTREDVRVGLDAGESGRPYPATWSAPETES